MNNRYATCLEFAKKASRWTGRIIVVLALPTGRFRAMFYSTADEFGLEEFITVTIANGERVEQ